MPDPRVPIFDTRPQFAAIESEIRAAMDAVLRRSWFILGEEVSAFEVEFAAYCGAGHAVGVANGTDAIELALRAAGVGVGDEVITVSLTAPFTALAILALGAVPVFVDVDPETLLMAPRAAASAVTAKTRAIMPVHLYGRPCRLDELSATAALHGVAVVADCAQAHGATVGGDRAAALGDVAAFSFYPTKNLGAYGDGGAVVTADPRIADTVRRLRNGGMGAEYRSDLPGRNSRLDELQAAILRVKLRKLDGWNARRREIAACYSSELKGVTLPANHPGHVYHLYVIRSPRRDALAAHLASNGIGAKVHYPWPVHEQPAFESRSRAHGDLANTRAACAEILSLPIFPEMSDAQVDAVIDAVNRFS